MQAELHRDLARFSVVVAHRRFGKTVFAVNELIHRALACRRAAPRCGYVAPLLVQAKSIAWDHVKHYTRPIPGSAAFEGELRVDLPNGARISLFGADNPDRLRGLYFDALVLDEVGDMPPRLWSEVLRPALADRRGSALFIGTPKGRNQFHALYQLARSEPGWRAFVFPVSRTGLIAPDELASARRAMSEAAYAQEFECAFDAAILGSYFGRELALAEREGRIGAVAHDPSIPVETWWDLGMSDATAIWFIQRAGSELRAIGYLEGAGEALGHWIEAVRAKGYAYAQHVAPHDIAVRELGTGKSRLEVARAAGLDFTIAPRLPLADGIDAVRRSLARVWFDERACAAGIEALRHYRRDFDEARKVFREQPRHDWASHAADALRIGLIAPPPADWGRAIAYPPPGIV